jgi:hypothetical protein
MALASIMACWYADVACCCGDTAGAAAVLGLDAPMVAVPQPASAMAAQLASAHPLMKP